MPSFCDMGSEPHRALKLGAHRGGGGQIQWMGPGWQQETWMNKRTELWCPWEGVGWRRLPGEKERRRGFSEKKDNEV